MKQTNTSNILYPTFKAKIGIVDEILDETAAFAISDITICPALILAINRTVRVKGRINSLTVSIRTSKGNKAPGAPAGARWAALGIGAQIQPEMISKPHIVKASDPANHRLLVAPYTNGINPLRFTDNKKNINANKNNVNGTTFLFIDCL